MQKNRKKDKNFSKLEKVIYDKYLIYLWNLSNKKKIAKKNFELVKYFFNIDFKKIM